MTDEDQPLTGDEKLSAELGVDVDYLELQVRLRLDLGRMAAGQTGELGYVLIDRDQDPKRYPNHEDVAVVFATVEEAEQAFIDHPLINSLCEENCLDAEVPKAPTFDELKGREIILP